MLRRWRAVSPEGSSVPLRLGFELVVIFVGVTLAFAVENYRERRNEDERRQQSYRALARELDVHASAAPQMSRTLGEILERFETARAAGERPAPAYYRERQGERVPDFAWEGVRLAGGVNLVEPDLYFRLAEYYGRIASISSRYARYNVFTEQALLPLSHAGPEAFYDGRGLKGEFAEHLARLAELREDFAWMGSEAAVMQGQVRARIR
jgi:hypothetical protein